MSEHRYLIDLARCTGCQACSIACKDRANLPDDLDWLRVEAHEGGTYPTPTLHYRVMHCFHCAEPPCVEACPTAAIARQADEWVQIDAGLCNGCGACTDACPFRAIVIRPEGIASKCDGCANEVNRGWEPACVRACPMRALGYGLAGALLEQRVEDPEFEDHGIGPSVLYLRRPGGQGQSPLGFPSAALPAGVRSSTVPPCSSRRARSRPSACQSPDRRLGAKRKRAKARARTGLQGLVGARL